MVASEHVVELQAELWKVRGEFCAVEEPPLYRAATDRRSHVDLSASFEVGEYVELTGLVSGADFKGQCGRVAN